MESKNSKTSDLNLGVQHLLSSALLALLHNFLTSKLIRNWLDDSLLPSLEVIAAMIAAFGLLELLISFIYTRKHFKAIKAEGDNEK